MRGRRLDVRTWVQVVCATVGALLTARFSLVPWQRRDPWDVVYPYQSGVMTDFRDTVMLPWEAIRQGANPYNIAQQRALFPHAQEFNPYAPWWLSATHPFAMFGWDTATLLYSVTTAVLTSVCAFYAGVLVVRGMGRRTSLSPTTVGFVMVVLMWLWRPTMIGQGLGNVGAVAALFAALALLEPSRSSGRIFVALAWVKPQFGIPLFLGMVTRGQSRTAVEGTLLAAFASLPMTITLAKIAGGPMELVDSVLSAAGEVGARTGGEPFAGRIDLAGLLASVHLLTGAAIPMAIGVLTILVAGLLDRRLVLRGRPGLGVFLLGAAVLFGFPHLHYDLPMILPLAVWAGWEAWREFRSSGRQFSGLLLLAGLAVLGVTCVAPVGVLGLPATLGQAWVLALALVLSLSCVPAAQGAARELDARPADDLDGHPVNQLSVTHQISEKP